MPGEQDNALHLISDILDKLIDSQAENAKVNAGHKESIDDLNDTLKELNSHFTNGFRSEIKKHVTEEIEPVSKGLESVVIQVKKLNDTLSKPSFWVKLVGAIVASLAIIIIAAMKLLEYLGGASV